MNTEKLRTVAAIAAIPLLVAACSWERVLTGVGIAGAAAAGGVAVYYAQGDLQADLDRSIDEVAQAAGQSLKQNGYNILEQDVGSERALIKAEDNRNGKDATVKIVRTSEEKIHLSIRYGLTGDEEKSAKILSGLRDILRTIPREGDPLPESAETQTSTGETAEMSTEEFTEEWAELLVEEAGERK